MGNGLNKPVELVRVQRHGSNNYKCGVADMQGWRRSFEDDHAVFCDELLGSFWVLDGHGGDAASIYCAPALAKALRHASRNGLPSDAKVEASFVQVDREFRMEVDACPDHQSGSTVVGAMCWKHEDGTFSVKLANAGDSRCLIVRAPQEVDGTARSHRVRLPEFMENQENVWPLILRTEDHKPDNVREKARIEAAGGFVSPDSRIDNNLAVSRSFGDFEYKGDPRLKECEQKVSCIPEVYEATGLEPSTILVLACDGLWDVMSNGEVAEFVRNAVMARPKDVDLGQVCADLVLMSLQKSSTDNVTCMAVLLGDGSAWAGRSNRFNSTDEMINFHKMRSQDLAADVLQEHRRFLARCKFPNQPQPCSISGRWFQEMFRCPATGSIYGDKSSQKKGWKLANKEGSALADASAGASASRGGDANGTEADEPKPKPKPEPKPEPKPKPTTKPREEAVEARP